MSTRITRSRSRAPELEDVNANLVVSSESSPLLRLRNDVDVRSPDVLPNTLTQSITGLTKRDLAVLKRKQVKLLAPSAQITNFVRDLSSSSVGTPAQALAEAAASTLVFAQEAAGTALCISPSGLLLTCSHCVAESEEELAARRTTWLVFSSGQVVKARCVAWDSRRDLALLQIVAAQSAAAVDTARGHLESGTFPSVQLADVPPKKRAALLCIGHPGSEDLEVAKPGVKTGYDVLHVSSGAYRGLAGGQDPQDNSEIGALKHDCWTYWGHSGAPLVERSTGCLIGLHSSWDDQSGMRRGVPLEAIKAFLGEHTVNEDGQR